MVIKKLPPDIDEQEELMDTFIEQGGKTKNENVHLKKEFKTIRFSLRVPEELINEIDSLRKKRFGKISRTLWIIEAIVAYLKV